MWCSGSFSLANALLRWPCTSLSSAPTTAQSTATASSGPAAPPWDASARVTVDPTAVDLAHPSRPRIPTQPSYTIPETGSTNPCPPAGPSSLAAASLRHTASPAVSSIPSPPASHFASLPLYGSAGLAARRRRPLLTLPLMTPFGPSNPSSSPRVDPRQTSLSATANRPLSQAALLSPLLLASPKSPHAIIERESRLTPSDPRMLALSPRAPAPTARRLDRSQPSRPSLNMFEDWDQWEDSMPLQPPRYGQHRGSRRISSAEADAWWAGMVDMMERQGRRRLSGTAHVHQPPAYVESIASRQL